MDAMVNSHALVVGVSAYHHVATLPPTVVNDARDVHGLLVDPTLGGYRPEAATLLVDGEATLDALRDALAGLAARSSAESTAVIYFSGHGARLESGEFAGEYLLPVDGRVDGPDALATTALAGAEFSTALRAIAARKVVVIFDCCHAGGVGQPKAAQGVTAKSGLPEQFYEALQSGRGRAILASSRSDEESWVKDGSPNSLFTTHLLAGLRGGIASEDGFIRIFDLFEYLQPRVTADEPRQHPVFKADLEENFPVALYQGGKPGVVAKDESGYRYDAFVSYVDRDPDATWVWDTLVPRLTAADLRVAVSGDVEEPGVERIVGIQRGITSAKRTLVVLSPAYLQDHWGRLENVMAQTLGVQEGTYRVLPVQFGPLDESAVPLALAQLVRLRLDSSARAERQWERLVNALRGPLPVA